MVIVRGGRSAVGWVAGVRRAADRQYYPVWCFFNLLETKNIATESTDITERNDIHK